MHNNDTRSCCSFKVDNLTEFENGYKAINRKLFMNISACSLVTDADKLVWSRRCNAKRA